MGEKFESRESGEDVADLLSSLTRELAESGGDINLAQMAQNAKDLWLRGEKAAAYWILEAFIKGQDNALSSLSKIDSKKDFSDEVVKDVCKEGGLRDKFGEVIFEMGKDENSLL